MRVFISGDIEGVTGVISWAQAEGPHSDHYDFPFARAMYTHDVNAAIRGARRAGATQVVVKDSHGGCRNLLVGDLEPGVELISGYGATPHGMMEGIQDGFDAAILVGYHARAGHPGLMAHALVGGLHRFWIDGVEAGEIAFSAAVAGAFGIPLVAVTSDNEGCREAEATIPGVATYAVKVSMGTFMARVLHPSVTGPGIESCIAEGLGRVREIPPYAFSGPVTMRIAFQTPQLAEPLVLVDGVARIDPYTLEWTSTTFLDAARKAYAVFEASRAARSWGD